LFAEYYTTPEIASAFGALYKNENGLLDKFKVFWDRLSMRFATNQNVIGFDILNEPWAANFYHEPLLFFIPYLFDQDVLYPFTKDLTEIILANAPDKIIFFESAPFPDNLPIFGGIVLNMGFPDLPGGKDRAHL
jgi:endoglycosylceramidase